MRHLLSIILLCCTSCNLLCVCQLVDGNAVLRVRDGIKKIPSSKKAATIDSAEWKQAKKKRGAPRAASPSFLQEMDNLLFESSFPKSISSRFNTRSVPQNREYANQSLYHGSVNRLHAAPTSTAPATFEVAIPWRRVVPLPKAQFDQKLTSFRTAAGVPSFSSSTQGKTSEMTLITKRDSAQLQPFQLSPYQRQQQPYFYQNQPIIYSAPAALAPPPPPSIQQYGATTQPTRYYNPLDPFGLFNNPLWQSLFPGFSVPQPQSVSAYAPQSGSSSQQLLTLIPKKTQLSPNEKLGLCCQKRNLSPNCQTLCNYDTFTDRSLVTAVISNQCPGNELETAFNCATSMADHSACCIRNGIGSYNGGRCMVFCTTHLGNPGNTLQYIDCLQVFDRIKNCYREYHQTHANMYGDF